MYRLELGGQLIASTAACYNVNILVAREMVTHIAHWNGYTSLEIASRQLLDQT